ncbi:transposase [Fastidiosibacter lacustris]
MRKRYPIDITRAQFAVIEPILLSARKKTAPRELAFVLWMRKV